MAAGTMATAAGAAVILYYMFGRKTATKDGVEDEEDENRSGDFSKSRSARRRLSRRPAQAPATWIESISTLSDTLRFTYSETLGKWPIGDLAFGINYLMRRQGNLQVASVYAGSDSVQLRGAKIIEELNYYLKLLTLCYLFSKKPFPVFLESGGFSMEDVLLQKPKAALLKPAFTILRDKDSKCFLLLIRGTHSIKDTLTAATGAVAPFHHSVLHDGGISNLILGYAHCGMVAAARWIAKLSAPCLLKALGEYPEYTVKVVGHSLGGGTAALLTYILREQREFSSSTCITFAPAACITMELAESGKHFITTIINGSDLVPTFSAASVDDLRSEVTASSWINDLRDQVERTRVLNVVYRSATALGSRLPSIASAKARVAGAGALLRPVSSSTQVVMKRAQNVALAVVRTRSSISSWSCMGARRRNVGQSLNSNMGGSLETSVVCERDSESLAEGTTVDPMLDNLESCSGGSGHDDTDEEEQLLPVHADPTSSAVEDITEGELWYELEKELTKQENEINVEAEKEEAAAVKEITEEENMLVDVAESNTPISSSDISESHRFYPPGRIMHIVSVTSPHSTDLEHDGSSEEHVGIYETRRELYRVMVLFPSFLDGLGRTMSIKKTKNCHNDTAKETAEELAKEAKKNELVLSSSGTVDSDKSNNFSSVCSKRGQKGINQDCLVIWEEFGCQEDMIFCGVFDGHGQWGHLVSKMVRQSMPSSLLCNWQETLSLTSLDLNFKMERDRKLHRYDTWKQSFLKTYADIDQKLKHSSKIDSYRSGTTALTIVKQGELLIIAHVGDSRAVLASTSEDGSLVPIQLTVDFKPNLPQEAERIRRSNGRVYCLPDEPGTYRVWMPNGKTPGLAVSRAFGDYCVKDFGLISVPDVSQRYITSKDQFVILATDGVWDVISNKEAIQIVSSAPDRNKAAKKLVACAALAWKSKRRGIAMDDISAICLFFHPNSSSQRTKPLVSEYTGGKKSGCM